MIVDGLSLERPCTSAAPRRSWASTVSVARGRAKYKNSPDQFTRRDMFRRSSARRSTAYLDTAG